MYQSARTTPLSRAFLLAEASRLGVATAARHMGVSRRTVYRWRRRAGDLRDRPCRPHRSPRRSSHELEARVMALRVRERWGPDRIAGALGMHASTVHRILRRWRANRLSHLFPKPPRSFGVFEASAPGEVVAIDTKQIGSLAGGGGKHHHNVRSRTKAGWRHLHVAIDAASRVAYTELRRSTGSDDTTAFLANALARFDAWGLTARRVLTDNGSGYKRRFDARCLELGVRHTRTKPYHPWTNGRAERFIGTLMRECLYGGYFTSDDERSLAVWHYLAYYNRERSHTALGGLAPFDWLRRRVTYVPGDLT